MAKTSKASEVVSSEDSKMSEIITTDTQTLPVEGAVVALNTSETGESSTITSGSTEGEVVALNTSETGESSTKLGDSSLEGALNDDRQGQWVSVRVVNSPYTTRRRAGFLFTRESQRIDLSELTHEQLDALSCDNCLEIKAVEAVSPSEGA